MDGFTGRAHEMGDRKRDAHFMGSTIFSRIDLGFRKSVTLGYSRAAYFAGSLCDLFND